ncbi:uncharacterized protein LOC110676513 isoform X2 [Aedes aegypti]|uniref:Uncharacterized protein n=1 Tax=Aedes aegypti TaxID=7159 RepID=A0A6I8U675_AEDAE|nr:uncharacterized protein LOC110676513 isoform X2 [Aedes aegypti]
MSATTFTVRNEHPAHRVQTRRISTTNLAVREQEKNRVQTRRMSIASGAARERQENLGHRLREQQDHLGQRVQTRRMSTALCTIREQQEHPGRSSVGKLQSQEHPGQNIQTQANRVQTRQLSIARSAVRQQQGQRVQTRRMSITPSAVLEQLEHSGHSAVHKQQPQISACEHKKRTNMKVAFAELPLEARSKKPPNKTAVEHNTQAKSPAQSKTEERYRSSQNVKAGAKPETPLVGQKPASQESSQHNSAKAQQSNEKKFRQHPEKIKTKAYPKMQGSDMDGTILPTRRLETVGGFPTEVSDPMWPSSSSSS